MANPQQQAPPDAPGHHRRQHQPTGAVPSQRRDASEQVANLPLRERRWDIFFMVVFTLFACTSAVSDAIPTLGVAIGPHASFLGRINWAYGHDTDPLFIRPPHWMRFVTGLSAFVYGPFYLLLVYCLAKGKNWIQVPAVMYATAISVITGVVVFGAEFFGEDPAMRVQNVPKFLVANVWYVLLPLLLLARMRKEKPFTRRF
jgi:hypothetical protein